MREIVSALFTPQDCVIISMSKMATSTSDLLLRRIRCSMAVVVVVVVDVAVATKPFTHHTASARSIAFVHSRLQMYIHTHITTLRTILCFLSQLIVVDKTVLRCLPHQCAHKNLHTQYANLFNLISVDFHARSSAVDTRFKYRYCMMDHFHQRGMQRPTCSLLNAHIYMHTSYANVANNISLFVKKFSRARDATCNKAQFSSVTNKRMASSSSFLVFQFHPAASASLPPTPCGDTAPCERRAPRGKFLFVSFWCERKKKAVVLQTVACANDGIVSTMQEKMKMFPNNSVMHGDGDFPLQFCQFHFYFKRKK